MVGDVRQLSGRKNVSAETLDDFGDLVLGCPSSCCVLPVPELDLDAAHSLITGDLDVFSPLV